MKSKKTSRRNITYDYRRFKKLQKNANVYDVENIGETKNSHIYSIIILSHYLDLRILKKEKPTLLDDVDSFMFYATNTMFYSECPFCNASSLIINLNENCTLVSCSSCEISEDLIQFVCKIEGFRYELMIDSKDDFRNVRYMINFQALHPSFSKMKKREQGLRGEFTKEYEMYEKSRLRV